MALRNQRSTLPPTTSRWFSQVRRLEDISLGKAVGCWPGRSPPPMPAARKVHTGLGDKGISGPRARPGGGRRPQPTRRCTTDRSRHGRRFGREVQAGRGLERDHPPDARKILGFPTPVLPPSGCWARAWEAPAGFFLVTRERPPAGWQRLFTATDQAPATSLARSRRCLTQGDGVFASRARLAGGGRSVSDLQRRSWLAGHLGTLTAGW